VELLSLGLAHNTSLRELSLARNSILASGAKKLARALESNTTLNRWERCMRMRERETLGCCAFPPFCCSLSFRLPTSLTRPCSQNPPLSLPPGIRLDLSGQRFEGLGPDGAEAIATLLRRNMTIEELNLSSNSIGAAGASALCNAIHAAGPGFALKRLAVGQNGLDSASIQALQEAAASKAITISV
jgi:hypothetical protein